MALLGRKKNTKTDVGTEVKEVAVVASKPTSVKFAATVKSRTETVIIRPRITEKASFKSESENVHVFEVTKKANKKSVAQAIHEMYKVTPVRVNIVNTPKKSVFVRGKRGTKSGIKKAYVYLKKEDKIEVI